MITQKQARQAIENTEKKARELGITITTVVVDENGLIVAASRMDNALPISPRFAFTKAYTASLLRMPTTTLAQFADPGKPYHGVTSIWNGEFTTIPGGLPITQKDSIVGGIGCGGGDPTQDEACAKSGLSAF